MSADDLTPEEQAELDVAGQMGNVMMTLIQREQATTTLGLNHLGDMVTTIKPNLQKLVMEGLCVATALSMTHGKYGRDDRLMLVNRIPAIAEAATDADPEMARQYLWCIQVINSAWSEDSETLAALFQAKIDERNMQTWVTAQAQLVTILETLWQMMHDRTGSGRQQLAMAYTGIAFTRTNGPTMDEIDAAGYNPDGWQQ